MPVSKNGKPSEANPEETLDKLQEETNNFNAIVDSIKNKLSSNNKDSIAGYISDTLQSLEDISTEANVCLERNQLLLDDYYITLYEKIEGCLTHLKNRLQLYKKDLPAHKTAGFEKAVDVRYERYVPQAIRNARKAISSGNVDSDECVDAKKSLIVQLNGLKKLYYEIEENYKNEKYSKEDRCFVRDTLLKRIDSDQKDLKEQLQMLEASVQLVKFAEVYDTLNARRDSRVKEYKISIYKTYKDFSIINGCVNEHKNFYDNLKWLFTSVDTFAEDHANILKINLELKERYEKLKGSVNNLVADRTLAGFAKKVEAPKTEENKTSEVEYRP